MKKCPVYTCKKVILTDGSEILPQGEFVQLTWTYGEEAGVATIESPAEWKGIKYKSLQLVFPNKSIFLIIRY